MAAAKKETTKKAAEKKASFEKFTARIVGGTLNVRKDPKIENGNIVTTLPENAEVEIIGEKGDFYKTKEGWIMTKFTTRV